MPLPQLVCAYLACVDTYMLVQMSASMPRTHPALPPSRLLQASDPYEAEFFDHLRRREAQQPTLWGYIGAGMSDIGDEHRQCMVNWLYEVSVRACSRSVDTAPAI